MTSFGRTAIVSAAIVVSAMLAIHSAAAREKKHTPASSLAPSEDVQLGPSGKQPAKTGKTDDDAQDAKAEAAAKPAAGATPTPVDKWTDAEIADAKARCAEVLQRIHAVYAAQEPIKKGACGAPAPIQLISIGQNPEVILSPPPVVRCDLAEALVNWLERDVQPLARKHYGAPVVKIETMSDYACRNAYGRKTTRLSEHGLANALDIGAFVMASSKSVSVLADWGTTQRDMLARLAEAKAAAAKKAEELAAAAKTGQANLASNGKSEVGTPAAPTASGMGAPAAGLARSTIIDGVPKLTVVLPGASAEAEKASNENATSKTPGKMAANVEEPARLGGPVPQTKAHARKQRASDQAARDKKLADASGRTTEDRAFLREAHTAACRVFGTTLGPEANADHLNHFHIDMAPRKFRKICD